MDEITNITEEINGVDYISVPRIEYRELCAKAALYDKIVDHVTDMLNIGKRNYNAIDEDVIFALTGTTLLNEQEVKH